MKKQTEEYEELLAWAQDADKWIGELLELDALLPDVKRQLFWLWENAPAPVRTIDNESVTIVKG